MSSRRRRLEIIMISTFSIIFVVEFAARSRADKFRVILFVQCFSQFLSVLSNLIVFNFFFECSTQPTFHATT